VAFQCALSPVARELFRRSVDPTLSMMRAFLIAVLVAIAGCATRTPAPVLERAPAGAPAGAVAPADVAAPPVAEASVPTYTVKRGDTLYLIALDKGLAYRDLAAWNNIENVNVIRVGQVLRLVPPGAAGTAAAPAGATTDPATGVVTMPLRPPAAITEARPDTGTPAPAATPAAPATARTADTFKTAPKAVKEPYTADAARDFAKTLAAANAAPKPPVDAAAAPAPVAAARSEPAARPASPAAGSDDDRLDWMWPAKGRVVGTFSDTANLKGVDIAGTTGQPVVASAAGKIVYAGNGLRGYGQLVIIKHNEAYLSAYAHNSRIVVKEGDAVTRGQKIAEMGNTDADQVKLHFEIRRQGKPMDPQKYLPAS
jgi:lipoprotein NlpD